MSDSNTCQNCRHYEKLNGGYGMPVHNCYHPSAVASLSSFDYIENKPINCYVSCFSVRHDSEFCTKWEYGYREKKSC